MLNGGLVTVMISNMDDAIRFYTETLGLALRYRAGNEWAEVDAGPGLVLGLHQASPHAPKPGTQGALSIGFKLSGSMDDAVAQLRERGVEFRHIVDNPQEGAKLAFFGDLDGNSLYLYEAPSQN